MGEGGALGKAIEGLMSALADWAASLDTSLGILRGVDPRAALLGTAAAVSSVAFSAGPAAPAAGLAAAALSPGRGRALRAAAVVGAFSAAVAAPASIWRGDPTWAILFALRAASSAAVLAACVHLAGAGPIFGALGSFGTASALAEALSLTTLQVSRFLRDLGDLLLARKARMAGSGLLGEYGILSSAVSELFIRAPAVAERVGAAARCRGLAARPEGETSAAGTAAFLALPAALVAIRLLAW